MDLTMRGWHGEPADQPTQDHGWTPQPLMTAMSSGYDAISQKKTVVCVFFYHLSSAETPSREHLSVFPAMDQPTVATRLRGTGFVTGWCPKKYVQLTACTLNISILGLEPPALCLQRKTILYVLFGKHRAGGWNMLKPPNRSWADVWKNSEAINESTLP